MSTNKYRHLFFDLDRTLWDFETNNHQTFRELWEKFSFASMGIQSLEVYFHQYLKINHFLWEEYKNQRITKEELNFRRFYESLLKFNIDNPILAKEIGEWYLAVSPQKTALYPDTHKVLGLLKARYQLHIITNGFEEVQFIKLEKSGLTPYFIHIITSERAGFKKPDERIFEFALKETGAIRNESVIIGDDPEADIYGGKKAGMDQIWIKHPPVMKSDIEPTYSVNNMMELLSIL